MQGSDWFRVQTSLKYESARVVYFNEIRSTYLSFVVSLKYIRFILSVIPYSARVYAHRSNRCVITKSDSLSVTHTQTSLLHLRRYSLLKSLGSHRDVMQFFHIASSCSQYSRPPPLSSQVFIIASLPGSFAQSHTLRFPFIIFSRHSFLFNSA